MTAPPPLRDSTVHRPVEIPLHVEQDVGLRALHILEVRLLHVHVIKVEPGLAVGRKCSVVSFTKYHLFEKFKIHKKIRKKNYLSPSRCRGAQ